MFRGLKPIHPPKPPKLLNRLQNPRTLQPLGKNKWVKAHWRYDYGTRSYEWVEGH